MASGGAFQWVRPAAISVGMGLVAYLASFLLAPTYLGYFSMYFPNNLSNQVFLAGVRDSGAGDQAAVRNFGGALTSPLVASGSQTATGIVESMTCAREVVQTLNLAERWGLSPDQALKRFAQNLSASTEKSGFLRVEFVGESRGLCAEVLNAVFAHLERRANQLTLNVSQKNRKFVENRYALAKDEVDQVQAKLAEMLSSNRLAGFDDVMAKYTSARLALQDLRVQEAVASATIALTKQNLQRTLNWTTASPLNLLSSESAGPLLSKAAEDLRAKRAAFESAIDRFTEASPEVQVARRDLKLGERITRQLAGIQQDAISTGLSPDLARAKIEMDSMHVSVLENEKLLKEFESMLPLSAREFANLDRTKSEFKAGMDQMVRLRGELELARIAEERDPSRFELVDPPQTEPDPVGPRRAFMAGIAFAIALVVQFWPALSAKMREAEA